MVFSVVWVGRFCTAYSASYSKISRLFSILRLARWSAAVNVGVLFEESIAGVLMRSLSKKFCSKRERMR